LTANLQMAFLGELRVPALTTNLSLVSGFVRGIGSRLRMSEQSLSELEPMMEQIAGRIMLHAYPRGVNGNLLLRAEGCADLVSFQILDWGRAVGLPDSVDRSASELEGKVTTASGQTRTSPAWLCTLTCTPSSVPGEPNRLTISGSFEPAPPGAPSVSTSRELNAMLAVSQKITTDMTLDELLAFIVNQLVETVEADRGTLYLVDEEQGEIYSRVLLQDTGDLKEIRLKLGHGVSGHVAATGETLNLRHAYADSRFARSFDQVTGYTSDSMLTMPMRNPQQKIIGVIQLLNKKNGGFFTDHDERLLTAMSSQAAVCIENTRLYRQEMLQQLTLREIEMARRIQESFLPREALRVPGFDIAGVCRYCDETGGDYFDFFHVGLENENRFAVVVGDVSGHGLSAALLMASARGLLRLRAAMPGEAANVVQDVNRQLCQDTAETGQFMTLFYGDVDAGQGTLNWAMAGHDPPLLFDRMGEAFVDLAGQGLALGLFEDYEYATFQHRFEPGQVLLVGTDGIWETHNSRGEMFGKTALKNVIRGCAADSAEEIQSAVIEALHDFRGEHPLEDDVTMVVVKALPEREKALDPASSRL